MAMTSPAPADTQELLDRSVRGDAAARQELLVRHRARLRRMVALRLDRRLGARLDPSDVVQEALADAAVHLDEYLRDRPLPFYPWLRQFAWERLCKLHRHHIHAQRRSINREELDMPLPDESVRYLAHRLLTSGTSPSRRLIRQEQREQVRAALAELAPRDREILVMRHLEQMETPEIAAALGITEGAVRNRQYRALIRLRTLLEGDEP
jgi:RNA polymerase sigma-70 factor (ECF subfamily)